MTKQTRIPGTERADHPDVEAACLAYCTARDERASLSRTEAQKKAEMFALMNVKGLDKYKFWDETAKRYRLARVKERSPEIEVVDTDEGVEEIGAGVASGDEPQSAAMAGLIAQATKAQDDANVEETEDGDVEVPDTAAPKKGKRK